MGIFNKKLYSYREAVDKAADYCIENDILKEILEAHQGEIRKMLLTEYNPKRHIKMERKEAWEEGHISGVEEGLSIGVNAFIQDNLEEGIAQERIMIKLQKRFNLSAEQARGYLEQHHL